MSHAPRLTHLAAFAPEATLSLLRSRLRQGIKATPLCIAVIGWLCDTPTDPAVAEIRHNTDGRVWLRLSDEEAIAPFGSEIEFLQQVSIVCQALGMAQGQTRAAVTWAKEKLSEVARGVVAPGE
jgi:hypothetical protein